jgi:hypothetical protein
MRTGYLGTVNGLGADPDVPNNWHEHSWAVDHEVLPDGTGRIFAYCECGAELTEQEIVAILDKGQLQRSSLQAKMNLADCGARVNDLEAENQTLGVQVKILLRVAKAADKQDWTGMNEALDEARKGMLLLLDACLGCGELFAVLYDSHCWHCKFTR